MMNRQFPTINMKATGRNICKLRKLKGLKVTDVSEFMGFAEPQAVYKWQRGESLPTVDNLYALSFILETKIEDILVGDDEVSSRHFRGKYRIEPEIYFWGYPAML